MIGAVTVNRRLLESLTIQTGWRRPAWGMHVTSQAWDKTWLAGVNTLLCVTALARRQQPGPHHHKKKSRFQKGGFTAPTCCRANFQPLLSLALRNQTKRSFFKGSEYIGHLFLSLIFHLSSIDLPFHTDLLNLHLNKAFGLSACWKISYLKGCSKTGCVVVFFFFFF